MNLLEIYNNHNSLVENLTNVAATQQKNTETNAFDLVHNFESAEDVLMVIENLECVKKSVRGDLENVRVLKGGDGFTFTYFWDDFYFWLEIDFDNDKKAMIVRLRIQCILKGDVNFRYYYNPYKKMFCQSIEAFPILDFSKTETINIIKGYFEYFNNASDKEYKKMFNFYMRKCGTFDDLNGEGLRDFKKMDKYFNDHIISRFSALELNENLTNAAATSQTNTIGDADDSIFILKSWEDFEQYLGKYIFSDTVLSCFDWHSKKRSAFYVESFKGSLDFFFYDREGNIIRLDLDCPFVYDAEWKNELFISLSLFEKDKLVTSNEFKCIDGDLRLHDCITEDGKVSFSSWDNFSFRKANDVLKLLKAFVLYCQKTYIDRKGVSIVDDLLTKGYCDDVENLTDDIFDLYLIDEIYGGICQKEFYALHENLTNAAATHQQDLETSAFNKTFEVTDFVSFADILHNLLKSDIDYDYSHYPNENNLPRGFFFCSNRKEMVLGYRDGRNNSYEISFDKTRNDDGVTAWITFMFGEDALTLNLTKFFTSRSEEWDSISYEYMELGYIRKLAAYCRAIKTIGSKIVDNSPRKSLIPNGFLGLSYSEKKKHVKAFFDEANMIADSQTLNENLTNTAATPQSEINDLADTKALSADINSFRDVIKYLCKNNPSCINRYKKTNNVNMCGDLIHDLGGEYCFLHKDKCQDWVSVTLLDVDSFYGDNLGIEETGNRKALFISLNTYIGTHSDTTDLDKDFIMRDGAYEHFIPYEEITVVFMEKLANLIQNLQRYFLYNLGSIRKLLGDYNQIDDYEKEHEIHNAFFNKLLKDC